MQNWIKTSLIAVLAASALFGSTVVMAKGGQHHQQAAAGTEQAKAEWLRQNEVQLARLELALVLTPEQKPAWEAFKAAIVARNETVLNDDLAIRDKVGEAATVVERLKRAEEATAQRSKLLGETRKDVEAFYAVLSDAQKKIFDDGVYRLLPSRQGATHTKKGKRGKK